MVERRVCAAGLVSLLLGGLIAAQPVMAQPRPDWLAESAPVDSSGRPLAIRRSTVRSTSDAALAEVVERCRADTVLRCHIEIVQVGADRRFQATALVRPGTAHSPRDSGRSETAWLLAFGLMVLMLVGIGVRGRGQADADGEEAQMTENTPSNSSPRAGDRLSTQPSGADPATRPRVSCRTAPRLRMRGAGGVVTVLVADQPLRIGRGCDLPLDFSDLGELRLTDDALTLVFSDYARAIAARRDRYRVARHDSQIFDPAQSAELKLHEGELQLGAGASASLLRISHSRTGCWTLEVRSAVDAGVETGERILIMRGKSLLLGPDSEADVDLVAGPCFLSLRRTPRGDWKAARRGSEPLTIDGQPAHGTPLTVGSRLEPDGWEVFDVYSPGETGS